MSAHRRFAEVSKAKDPRGTLARLLPYFAPHVGRLGLICVLLLVGTLAELAGPYLIGLAVDAFISPGGSAWPAWLVALLGAGVDRRLGLSLVMLMLAASYLVIWVMNVVQFQLMVRIAQRVLLTMRTRIFEHIQALSLSFLDAQEAGDLMSRLSNDTQVINDMFGPGLMRVLRMVLGLVGIAISMLALNWRLALASYAILPIISLATASFSRRARRAFRQTRKTIGDVSAELQENIAGVREVQAFSREAQNVIEFQVINERNRLANVEAQTLMSAFMPLLDVLSTSAYAIVVGCGGYLILNYDPPLVSVGVIVSLLAYVQHFYGPIRELSQLYGQLQSAMAGAERVFDLLGAEPAILDAPNALDLPTVKGRVEYEHVSFRYVEDEPVIQDVSFAIEPGQTVALVGPTGAGKTTLAHLLVRFYDIDQGALRVDGHDVRDVTRSSLRGQIGLVLQDTFLFSGTVADTIRYGRLEATDDQVVQAAKLANAHQFIQRLPKAYETEIGERGATLSHGNRQLLAIARAILKDPGIMVLDEATSSVDTRTELLIQRALAQLLEGRSSLVIAHRLSTIRNADQILVIDEGRIVERGTHESLLALGGVYHGLYMSQFRRQERVEPEPEPSASVQA